MMVRMTSNRPWLLLIVRLPTTSATARMRIWRRIWRSLKALACPALRDGACPGLTAAGDLTCMFHKPAFWRAALLAAAPASVI